MKSNALADDCCRVGFIDEAGKLIIDFKFYYAGEFREGLSAVVLTKGGKWGYVDESGTFAIDSQFDEATSFSDGFAKVSKDGKSFFITKAGKKAFDTSLLLLGFKDGISPAQFRGAWGFVSREGKVLIPFKFQAANPFYEGLSAVTQNNLVGYIDKSGNWVLALALVR